MSKKNTSLADRIANRLDDKTIAKFYGFIALLIIATTPLWLPPILEQNRLSKERQQNVEQIRADCKGGKDVGDEILTYHVYYDNGVNELPTCRLPKTADEKAEMYRIRAYRQNLEAGNVDEPTLDENCTRYICQ